VLDLVHDLKRAPLSNCLALPNVDRPAAFMLHAGRIDDTACRNEALTLVRAEIGIVRHTD
jgi:hypothetical protein